MRFTKLSLILILIVLAALSGVLIQIVLKLPDVETLDYYAPSEATVLFTHDGKLLARFHEEENRRVVPLSRISPTLLKVVVAVEDENFFSHHGLDYGGLARAMFKNIMAGRIVEGGSTITQQLARNVYLTRRKNILRKLAEAILAIQIERRYTKEEILELYLNQVYFGHNAYGIESAADLYFDKHAKDLNLPESALLVGILKGPELYSPYRNPEKAKFRQKVVLNKLADMGLISDETAQKTISLDIELHPENLRKFGHLAPYFVSHVLKQLTEEYGENVVNQGGLRVYTTLDADMQLSAEVIAENFLKKEGPKYNFSQLAIIALDPRNGHIKAMVGGADFTKSQFNRATQAKRQPGSAFKPFVYTAAIEKGLSPGMILSDRETIFEVTPNKEWNPDGKWEPKNFDKKFRGNVTMQRALEKSFNIPSIKLLEKVGVGSAISVARRMGIKSHLEPALALTLGVSEVTPLEITSAFGVFATGGVRVEPSAISKILNRDGVMVYQYVAKPKRVLNENVAAIMVDMMKGVLLRGTGVHGRLERPAAAKTGTTEEFKDAWFIGFTPQLACGVWVGNDDNTTMEGIAEVAVCPRIFKAFMTQALKDEPPLDFPQPQGLITAKICLSSGQLPNAYCPEDKIVEAKFFEKDVPISECYVHPRAEPEIEEDENLEDVFEKEEIYEYEKPKEFNPYIGEEIRKEEE